MGRKERRKDGEVKWVRDRKGEAHAKLTTEEARQARYGKPVFYVLITSLAGVVIAFLVVGYAFF